MIEKKEKPDTKESREYREAQDEMRRETRGAYQPPRFIVPEHLKAKGGTVKMAKGGSVGSASKRADGCAIRGKTKGRII